MPEVTKAQSVYASQTSLTKVLLASYDTYRTIRKNPTVALARALSVAPIIAGQWSIESDDGVDDERIKFIQDQFMNIREPTLEVALYGGIDFGWQPFEVVYEEQDGKVILKKLKPLLQDMTDIEIVEATGAYDGFKQNDLRIPVENTLCVYFRIEGTNWYGTSLLENIRNAYNNWVEGSDAASRYDAKVAGSHFVIHYPIGKSPDADGTETENDVIAKAILTALEGSGSVCIPQRMLEYVDELNAKDTSAWKIEVVSDNSPKQASFNERLRYLDKQFVRGLLIPERAILEGQFGTKAEAGQHADLALTHMDLVHRHVTRLINWHVVDRILVLNYGDDARGTIRLVAAPLADETLSYIRTVYDKILTNPQGFMEEFPFIDTDSLKDSLSVPKSLEVASPEEPDDIDEEIPIEDEIVEDAREEMENADTA